MIIIVKPGAGAEAVREFVESVHARGLKTSVVVGTEKTIVGVIGDTRRLDDDQLLGNPIVQIVKHVSEPFKRANRQFHPDDTVVEAGGAKIGGGHFALVAGPCSVESREQIIEVAKAVKTAGATMLRGGAFKPRTSPYDFQGLKADGLELLLEAKRETGLPIVTEIMNISHLPLFEHVDVIQVGARSIQKLRASQGTRTQRQARPDQARTRQHPEGTPDGGRIRHGGRQRQHHSVRAGHPHI